MRVFFFSCTKRRQHRARTFRGRSARMRGCCPSRRRRLHAWPGMLPAPSSIFLPGAAHGGAPGAGARLRTTLILYSLFVVCEFI